MTILQDMAVEKGMEGINHWWHVISFKRMDEGRNTLQNTVQKLRSIESSKRYFILIRIIE